MVQEKLSYFCIFLSFFCSFFAFLKVFYAKWHKKSHSGITFIAEYSLIKPFYNLQISAER